MTCLLPVYTSCLPIQHHGVDSWDSASHWDTLWLAPPYVLFPWIAGPVGSAWPRCVFCCSQNDSHSFVLHPVELQQFGPWQGCETLTIVNDTWHHTLIQQEQMKLFDAFCSHGFQHRQSFHEPKFCWFNLLLVRQHSVEAEDPEVSEIVHAFYDFSIEGDCWHCLSNCFIVEGAPQGLCIVWTDFGLSPGTIVTLFSSCALTVVTLCRCHWLFCRIARRSQA